MEKAGAARSMSTSRRLWRSRENQEGRENDERDELQKDTEEGDAFRAPAVLDLENLRQLVDQRAGHHAKAQEFAEQHLKTPHVYSRPPPPRHPMSQTQHLDRTVGGRRAHG